MDNFPFFNHPRRRYYIKHAIYILISWILVSNVLFFYEYFLLSSNDVLSTRFDLRSNFIANLIVGISAGLFGGVFTINLMENWLRSNPFWKALLKIFFGYTITAIIVTFLAIIYLKSTELGLAPYQSGVLQEVLSFFGTWFFIRNYIMWFMIVISTLILLMVNDKYGPGVFADFLMGKYFQPKREERIFMFIDIRSATTIAEKIGEERYFYFLKDFFKDITPAIVFTRGEIYQYVGDEVVVSWKIKNGIYKTNVLRCYFEMKRIIQSKGHTYLSKYYAIPDFKVGIHLGQVMTGEIGQIKREIAFSGDTLNTAARIQSMCNDFEVDILSSAKFVEALPYFPNALQKIDLGKHDLKGKAEQVQLFTFKKSIAD